MEKLNFVVSEEYVSCRIDKYLCENIKDISRNRVKELLDLGNVVVNNKNVKASKKLNLMDKVEISIPEDIPLSILPENIPLKIVYEDKDIAIIDKATGISVHPANNIVTGTLVNAIMYHIKDLSSINGVIRPGIVHRIDKDTSGLLVIAKNNFSHNHLSSQFKDHSINRRYKAIVSGVISENEGMIDAPIGRHKVKRKSMCVTFENSKHAVTHFNVEKRYENYSLIDLKLETGRTHQIRVHMKYINHPLIGDKVYGRDTKLDRMFSGQLLHAYKLGLIHPSSGEYMEFNSDLPKDFYKLI